MTQAALRSLVVALGAWAGLRVPLGAVRAGDVPWHIVDVSPTPDGAPPTYRPPNAAGGRLASGGTLDTVTFWSQSLGTNKHAIVWLPPSYRRESARRYPVAYYLHGLHGSEGDWTRQVGLNGTLDSLTGAGLPEMIVVMPDGDDGWYMTWNRLLDISVCRHDFTPSEGDPVASSYCVPWSHYDDYIARDLVAFIDAHFRTRADRAHRGIAGLSMGGYGAISLALRYPEVYAAAASHSGVLSPRYAGAHPFDGTTRYAASIDSLRAGWGEKLWPLMWAAFGNDSIAWRSRDPAWLAQHLHDTQPALFPAVFIDCGSDDGLIDHSRAFRSELLRLGVTPHYAEWPGKHDWLYWRRHAPESVVWLARQLSGS